ncbi:hypothetical protein BJ970_006855 [Saccharopolyspora phatthalungensis]|uniref:Protein kinase domain-containing protein n=2 Tax=Saccharopolyspora phatthalungensis TaxID=664693 RepID=A0A840QFN7_9PSEU|nr:hypothetical protein [Saccharopolyspora phatthalungensis]
MLRLEAGVAADLKEWRTAQRTDEVADEIAQFQKADFVLVMASPEMRRLMDSTQQGPVGDTTHIGAAQARDKLAGDLRKELKRMLPVVLRDATAADIPRILQRNSATFYPIRELDVDSDGVQDLLHALHDVPRHAKPPLGIWTPPAAGPWEAPGGQQAESVDVVLQPGAVIVLGEHTYLVHGEVETPAGEGGPAVLRQAPALRLGDPNERVWLRQVERKADTRGTREAFAALEKEHELLAELDGRRHAAPRQSALVDAGRTRTLVLAWPRRNAPAEDFQTLADHVPHPNELDSIAVRRTLHALAGLCCPLAALHRHQCTHRELAPHTIVRIDDGHLALRDLGAAGRPALPGEDGSVYRAPEQTRLRRGRIGPWTDVFRLAAVAYHLISGQVPDEARPLPTRAVCPVAPDQAATAIDTALHPDPARRPAVAELATAFRM